MIGVLLINVGTPDSPQTKDVQKYLTEFLTDKEVIRGPWFVREILFKHYIIPKRAPHSAKKYEYIWTPEGSPLKLHSLKLATDLQQTLGGEYCVELGMRYGSPSIETAIQNLVQKKVSKIYLLPLFPQYANATTKTSLDKSFEVLERLAPGLPVQVMSEFYEEPGYLDVLTESIRRQRKGDHLLFSFHGLPVSHLKGKSGCYQSDACCESFKLTSPHCYRAQCLFTAKTVAQNLGLKDGTWSVSFQSRLGPVKWIEPYTDQLVRELPSLRGQRKLDVCAPAFVADGLETLEEICKENADHFQQSGGELFNYIPCLNTDSDWVQWLRSYILNTTSAESAQDTVTVDLHRCAPPLRAE